VTVSFRGLRSVLAGVALLAAFLLALSELLPLYEVVVGQSEEGRRSVRGASNHAFAMLLLAAAATAMALGARRGSRPAMAALAVLGVVVLVVVLTVDLPAVRQEGALREAAVYEDARAEPRAGFFAETLGGVLLLLSGGAMLLAGRDEPRRARRRERERERGGLADVT
jgi:hypothetical protein